MSRDAERAPARSRALPSRGANPMTCQIFLSYKSADLHLAQNVFAELARAGLVTFHDAACLTPEAHALEAPLAARVVLVLWSPSSVDDHHVLRTAELAARSGRYVGVATSGLRVDPPRGPCARLTLAETLPEELLADLRRRVERRAPSVPAARTRRALSLAVSVPKKASPPSTVRRPRAGDGAPATAVGLASILDSRENRTHPAPAQSVRRLMFVCAPEDRDRARRLAGQIAADPWWTECILAPARIPPGETEETLIDTFLHWRNGENIVCVLWSRMALQSNRVRRMARRASDRELCVGIRLEPVGIPPSVVGASLELATVETDARALAGATAGRPASARGAAGTDARPTLPTPVQASNSPPERVDNPPVRTQNRPPNLGHARAVDQRSPWEDRRLRAHMAWTWRIAQWGIRGASDPKGAKLLDAALLLCLEVLANAASSVRPVTSAMRRVFTELRSAVRPLVTADNDALHTPSPAAIHRSTGALERLVRRMGVPSTPHPTLRATPEWFTGPLRIGGDPTEPSRRTLELLLAISTRSTHGIDLWWCHRLLSDLGHCTFLHGDIPPDVRDMAQNIARIYWAEHRPAARNAVRSALEPWWLRIPPSSSLVDDSGGPPSTHPPSIVVSAFEMLSIPIRRDWYEAFDPNRRMGKAAHRGGDLPAVGVSWYEAAAFARWLGAEVDLPTEVEWEYACRAGTSTRFWSGDSIEDLSRVAWFDGNSGARPHPVGTKPSNPWGLHDMHGNVWEWCSSGHASPSCEPPALRGGAWNCDADHARVTSRRRCDAFATQEATGFRLVRRVQPAREPPPGVLPGSGKPVSGR